MILGLVGLSSPLLLYCKRFSTSAEAHSGAAVFTIDSQMSSDNSVVAVRGEFGVISAVGKVRFRGRSSKNFDKRSLTISLHDGHFLGPFGSQIVLSSCYADMSCMRNQLGQTIAGVLGLESAKGLPAEVSIEGTYIGLFEALDGPNVLFRRWLQRVREKSGHGSSDSEDFVAFRREGESLDEPDSAGWISHVTGVRYLYSIPKASRIAESTKSELIRDVSALELTAGRDEPSRRMAQFDIDSWAAFALVQEIAKNPDAYWKSVHFAWSRRERKIWIPMSWDFDLAFGNSILRGTRTTAGFVFSANALAPEAESYGNLVPIYWTRLWSDARFQAAVRCRWDHLKRETGQFHKLDDWLGEISDRVEGGAERNFEKWGYPMNAVWALGDPPSSPRVARANLRHWLTQRLAWLDRNLPGTCTLILQGN